MTGPSQHMDHDGPSNRGAEKRHVPDAYDAAIDAAVEAAIVGPPGDATESPTRPE
ncbi:hypothetical protein GCM10022420_046980 [Streptomyces iranensis]